MRRFKFKAVLTDRIAGRSVTVGHFIKVPRDGGLEYAKEKLRRAYPRHKLTSCTAVSLKGKPFKVM